MPDADFYSEDQEGQGTGPSDGTAMTAGVSILGETIFLSAGSSLVHDDITTAPVIDSDLGPTFAARLGVSGPTNVFSIVEADTISTQVRPTLKFTWRSESIGSINSTGGGSKGPLFALLDGATNVMAIHFAGGTIQILETNFPNWRWLDSSGNIVEFGSEDATRWVVGQTYDVEVQWVTDTTYNILMAPVGSSLVKQNNAAIPIVAGTGAISRFLYANSRLQDVGGVPQNRDGNYQFGHAPPQALILAQP